MANENIKLDEGIGSVRIADEVVSIIAGMAATEVDGIAGMSGGLVGGIAEILGKKNLAKGVKVEVGETEAAVDLYIIVKFGVRIPFRLQLLKCSFLQGRCHFSPANGSL